MDWVRSEKISNQIKFPRRKIREDGGNEYDSTIELSE